MSPEPSASREESPDRVSEVLGRADALRQAGRYSDAVRVLADILEGEAESASAYYCLGNVYIDSGDLARAEAAYRRAIDLEPHHANALNNLAVVYKRQNRINLFVKTYRRAQREAAKAPIHARDGQSSNRRVPRLARPLKLVIALLVLVGILVAIVRLTGR